MIEILLVVSLMSVISVALFHTLTNGLKIWERSRQFSIEEDIDIFFDKISRELQNTFPFTQMGFEGKETSLRFAASVRSLADAKLGLEPGAMVERIGSVEYYFDPWKKTVYKRQANYSQAIEHKAGQETPLLHHVKALKFLYYFSDADGNIDHTKSISSIPVAVQIEIEPENDDAEGNAVKLVNIPVGI